MRERHRTSWLAALVISLVVIVMATTWPWAAFQGHAHWAKVEWVPFTYYVRRLDLLLNVLLFLPFGYSIVGLSNRRASPLLAAAAGCLLSVAVEIVQVYSHARIPTTVDVVTNTLGAWLGARLASRTQVSRPDDSSLAGRRLSA